MLFLSIYLEEIKENFKLLLACLVIILLLRKPKSYFLGRTFNWNGSISKKIYVGCYFKSCDLKKIVLRYFNDA